MCAVITPTGNWTGATMLRATVSIAPLAASGTIKRIGRSG